MKGLTMASVLKAAMAVVMAMAMAAVYAAVAAVLLKSREIKRFRERARGDALVANEMRANLAAEEAVFAQKRKEFRLHMQQAHAKKRAEKDLRQIAAQLKTARKENREALEVVASREEAKKYSLESLGHGKKKAGGAQCAKVRGEVLQRVRLVGQLSLAQKTEWDYFKTEWDKVMAETHGEKWAELFSEYIQNVHNELDNGNRGALSEFLHRETQRVLTKVPVLQIRGTSVQTQP